MFRSIPTTALVLALSAAHAAQSVSLTSDRDTSLYQSGTGALSNGKGHSLFAGVTFTSSERRAQVHFDVAGSVPAGATISSVQLVLNLTKTMSGNVPMSVHRVSQAWGEGNSNAGGEEGGGAGSQSGDATWLHNFFSGSFWNAAGGDFNSSASATATVGFLTGSYAWSSAQLVADVQDMLDNPGSNFGFLVRSSNPQVGNAKRFGSRESANPGQRPRLDIVYNVGPTAAASSVGVGCAGSSGNVYALTNVGLPQLGNSSFGLFSSQGPASALSFLFFASGTGPGLPILSPTCLIYLELNSALLFASSGVSPLVSISLNSLGAGTFNLPIPNNQNLLGLPFGVQAVAVDFLLPSLLVTSNAVDLTFGT